MPGVPGSPSPTAVARPRARSILRRAVASLRIVGEIAGVLVFACALFAFAGGLGMLFWWLVTALASGFDRPAQP